MARWHHAPLFRGRHFADDVSTLAVHWYSRYSLSFRELENLLRERHIVVDHTTLWHWVQRYAPELDKRLRSHLRPTGKRWHVDETYVRVGGEWVYLYRAVDETGATVDFLLAQQRSVRQAKLFFRRALETPERPVPDEIFVDGLASYPIAVRALQREGRLPKKVRWRCRAHGNNWIEQDHRGIKQRYYPMLGFQSFRSAKRFCRSFDELRHYFRPRRSPNQFVPSAQRRQQFKRKLAVLQTTFVTH